MELGLTVFHSINERSHTRKGVQRRVGLLKKKRPLGATQVAPVFFALLHYRQLKGVSSAHKASQLKKNEKGLVRLTELYLKSAMNGIPRLTELYFRFAMNLPTRLTELTICDLAAIYTFKNSTISHFY